MSTGLQHVYLVMEDEYLFAPYFVISRLTLLKGALSKMTKPSTIKAIYRCVLRDATDLQRVPHFRLREPVELQRWGVGDFVEPRLDEDAADKEPIRIRTMASYLEAKKRGFRPEDRFEKITDMVRGGFKEYMHLTETKTISQKVDEAIGALKEVSDQLILAKCSSVTTTNGVRIEATSQFIPSHSDPEQNVFRFAYRITITNEDPETPIQITGRQYTFMSEKKQRIALPRHSPGIVGHTPIIQPGQTFEYVSGIDFDSPRAVANGCLHTIRRGDDDAPLAEEDVFDAYVSMFHFIAPGFTSASR